MQEELSAIFSNYHGSREEIIPILQAVQEEFTYLPSDAMEKIARFTRVAASNVFAIATFYAQFRFEPLGRNHIMVCRGTACHVRGAQDILEKITETLEIEGEGTTEDQEYTVETVACIGCCALAPVMTVNEEVHGNLTKNEVIKYFKKEGKSNGRE